MLHRNFAFWLQCWLGTCCCSFQLLLKSPISFFAGVCVKVYQSLMLITWKPIIVHLCIPNINFAYRKLLFLSLLKFLYSAQYGRGWPLCPQVKKKKEPVPVLIQKCHLRIKVNKFPDYCLLVLQIYGILKRHCREQLSGGQSKSMLGPV